MKVSMNDVLFIIFFFVCLSSLFVVLIETLLNGFNGDLQSISMCYSIFVGLPFQIDTKKKQPRTMVKAVAHLN